MKTDKDIRRIRYLQRSTTLAAFATFALGLAASRGAVPLYEFTFNDPANGTQTANSGTANTFANMNKYGTSASASDRIAADLHGADASGVSGKPGDYAFATGADRMSNIGGTNGQGGTVILTDAWASLNGLRSWTLQGWYKTEAALPTGGNSVPLFTLDTRLTIGFSAGAFSITSAVAANQGADGGTTGNSLTSTAPVLYTESAWVFVAVTWDGATGLLSLYAGTENDKTVAPVTSASIASGYLGLRQPDATHPERDIVIVGDGTGYNRPFKGLMDNVRIYGDRTGSGGALALTALQSLMTADLAGPVIIPEPANASALAGAVFLLVGALLYRHRCHHRHRRCHRHD
ncbi:MAG: LamG domain-containing protein [Opitutaceae bacterium]|jgi:hypothetical protein|nr:LamG domain-containing protein [Opitutaceae bacterium]